MELLFSFVTIFSWSYKSRKSQTIHHKSREIRSYKMFALFRETSIFSFNFFGAMKQIVQRKNFLVRPIIDIQG